MPDPEDVAAETYKTATGHYPEGYAPPGSEPQESTEQAAARIYFEATGRWPGEKPAVKPLVEAPADKFSHYLTLANGEVKRYAANDRDPHGPFPTSFDGVPVISVQNAIPSGEDDAQ